MKLALALTLDGLIRALRGRAHREADRLPVQKPVPVKRLVKEAPRDGRRR